MLGITWWDSAMLIIAFLGLMIGWALLGTIEKIRQELVAQRQRYARAVKQFEETQGKPQENDNNTKGKEYG